MKPLYPAKGIITNSFYQQEEMIFDVSTFVYIEEQNGQFLNPFNDTVVDIIATQLNQIIQKLKRIGLIFVTAFRLITKQKLKLTTFDEKVMNADCN